MILYFINVDLAVGQQQPMQFPGTPPPVKKQLRRGEGRRCIEKAGYVAVD